MVEIDRETSERLENLLVAKNDRLPKSVRAYIRELKRTGNFNTAMAVRNQAVEKQRKTREAKLKDELNSTIRKILETEEPQLQGELEIKAIWLLDRTHIINSEERVREIIATLDSKSPTLKSHLEEKLAGIRDSVANI